MNRVHDYVKEFKNGNLNIKYDSNVIEDAKKDEIATFSDVLFWNDCYLFGEEFCISNYDMGLSIYNYYLDVWYVVSFSELEKLLKGKTIKLYAHKVDNDIREELNKDGRFS